MGRANGDQAALNSYSSQEIDISADQLADQADSQALFGDQILLLGIELGSVASFILGFQFIDATLAIGATLGLVVVAAAAHLSAKGSAISKYVLALVLICLVVLHIQLARGMVEFRAGADGVTCQSAGRYCT